jgi:hypothetical protein
MISKIKSWSSNFKAISGFTPLAIAFTIDFVR